MCGCKVKIGTVNDASADVTAIPLNGVLKNDFFTLLAYAWCINPEKVKAAFRKIGMENVDADDFPVLIESHASGADVKVHGVSFSKLISDIKFTEQEYEKASCSTILTR